MAGPSSDCHSMSSDHQPASRPPKQTCETCRARKVKCDGRPDCCSNCERLQYACSFRRSHTSHGSASTSTASSTGRTLPPTHSATRGRRVSRACRGCHMAKTRCTGALPACARCIGRGMECVYPPSASGRSGQPQPNPSSPRAAVPGPDHFVTSIMPESSELPPQQSQFTGDILATAVADAATDHDPEAAYHQYPLLTRARVLSAMRGFFDRFHPFPGLCFLHKPSLLQLYSSHEADPALMAAIVAVASRLPGTTPEEMSVGFQCASVAEDIVRDTLGQPSVFRLQALVLLLRFRLWTGSPNDALLLSSHLARSAFLLRLNYETFQPVSFFVHESRRRLMWAIYVLDVLLADGLQQYTACPISEIHLQLPCTEDDFELNCKTQSENIEQAVAPASSSRLGIIAYSFRIIHLRVEILRYTKRLINLRIEPDGAYSGFLHLEKQLKAFQSRLPEHERYSQKNLSLRVFFPRLSRWVMTHVWWHICHCQLFRVVVCTIPPTFSQRLVDRLGEALAIDYQRRCLEHAVSVASIFSQLRDMVGDTCVLDMEMAECAFKASEILLLSSESARSLLGVSQADVLQHVSVCLQLAESLLAIYPAVSPIVSHAFYVLSSSAADCRRRLKVADLTRALRSFAQGGSCSLAVPVEQTSPKQIVTKHSALYRSEFADDMDKLEMHDNTSKTTGTSPRTSAQSMNEDEQTSLESCEDFGQDAIPSVRDHLQAEFSWPGVLPDHWDRSLLFQGAFGADELDAPHLSGRIEGLSADFPVGSVA